METMLSTAGGGAPGPIAVPDVLQPGAKAGPWVVERELGRGGMGAVYAVVHDEIGKRAALKVVHGRLLGTGFNPDRMLVEARVVNQVGHPNIVDIFETGKLPDGRPYIVMERLEGQSLSQRADSGKIRADLVVEILLQICDALIAAHAAGIVHRDLKLDNVFLVDNPDDPKATKAKLLDWGIAKIIHHDVHHTVEGQLVGTPQYLAPEQARGAQVSPKADVYSLGIMAYELFLEQLPFEAETAAEVMVMHLRAVPPPPSELWPDIPAQLEALILSMLAKQPDHRPTMLEVARQLELVREELLRRRTGAVDAVSLPETPRPSRRISVGGFAATEMAEAPVRHPRWQYAVGGLAVAALAAMFLLVRGGDSAAAATRPAETAVRAAALAPSPAAIRADERVASPAPAPAPAPVEHAAAPAHPATPANTTTNASRGAATSVAPAAVSSSAAAAAQRPPRAERARPAPGVHSRGVPATTRRAPVAPRRATKLDPNGTVDPFR